MNSNRVFSTYWVTCADGLETLLREEIEGLGVKILNNSRVVLIKAHLKMHTVFACGHVWLSCTHRRFIHMN